HRARSLDPQDVVRIDRTLGETITSAHAITFVHSQVLAGSDFVQLCFARLVERTVVVDRSDKDLALAALDLAEPHHTVNLGDRRRIFRTTSLEHLRQPSQCGDGILHSSRRALSSSQRRSRKDALSIVYHELCARGDDEVAHTLLLPALLLNDLD